MSWLADWMDARKTRPSKCSPAYGLEAGAAGPIWKRSSRNMTEYEGPVRRRPLNFMIRGHGAGGRQVFEQAVHGRTFAPEQAQRAYAREGARGPSAKQHRTDLFLSAHLLPRSRFAGKARQTPAWWRAAIPRQRARSGRELFFSLPQDRTPT